MALEKGIALSPDDAIRDFLKLFAYDPSLPIMFYTTLLASIDAHSHMDKQTVEDQLEQIISRADDGTPRETLQDQLEVIEDLIHKTGDKAVKKYIWSILDALS